MNSTPAPFGSKTRGFTLAEILVSTTIIGLTTVAIAVLMRQSLNMYYYDSGRIMINRDIRSFTGEMTTNAVFSNYFRVYPNFTTRSTTTGNVTVDASVSDGQSGDFLVLVYADTDATTGNTAVTQLIGYYRDVTDTTANTGPVRRFNVAVPNVNPAQTPLYTMLNTYAPTNRAHTNPVVVQLAQGLSNGLLFYDFYDRSIMIKGQIIEQGSLTKRAVNTYNFTVSPRG